MHTGRGEPRSSVRWNFTWPWKNWHRKKSGRSTEDKCDRLPVSVVGDCYQSSGEQQLSESVAAEQNQVQLTDDGEIQQNGDGDVSITGNGMTEINDDDAVSWYSAVGGSETAEDTRSRRTALTDESVSLACYSADSMSYYSAVSDHIGLSACCNTSCDALTSLDNTLVDNAADSTVIYKTSEQLTDHETVVDVLLTDTSKQDNGNCSDSPESHLDYNALLAANSINTVKCDQTNNFNSEKFNNDSCSPQSSLICPVESSQRQLCDTSASKSSFAVIANQSYSTHCNVDVTNHVVHTAADCNNEAGDTGCIDRRHTVIIASQEAGQQNIDTITSRSLRSNDEDGTLDCQGTNNTSATHVALVLDESCTTRRGTGAEQQLHKVIDSMTGVAAITENNTVPLAVCVDYPSQADQHVADEILNRSGPQRQNSLLKIAVPSVPDNTTYSSNRCTPASDNASNAQSSDSVADNIVESKVESTTQPSAVVSSSTADEKMPMTLSRVDSNKKLRIYVRKSPVRAIYMPNVADCVAETVNSSDTSASAVIGSQSCATSFCDESSVNKPATDGLSTCSQEAVSDIVADIVNMALHADEPAARYQLFSHAGAVDYSSGDVSGVVGLLQLTGDQRLLKTPVVEASGDVTTRIAKVEIVDDQATDKNFTADVNPIESQHHFDAWAGNTSVYWCADAVPFGDMEKLLPNYDQHTVPAEPQIEPQQNGVIDSPGIEQKQNKRFRKLSLFNSCINNQETDGDEDSALIENLSLAESSLCSCSPRPSVRRHGSLRERCRSLFMPRHGNNNKCDNAASLGVVLLGETATVTTYTTEQ